MGPSGPARPTAAPGRLQPDDERPVLRRSADDARAILARALERRTRLVRAAGLKAD